VRRPRVAYPPSPENCRIHVTHCGKAPWIAKVRRVMGRVMRWFTLVAFVVLGAIACGKGGKGAKSSSSGDPIFYDAEGNGKECPEPKSNCDETKDATLDFKDRCSDAGFDMKVCGCEQLCSGNIVGKRKGYDNKNNEKTCEPPGEKCELPETSAAFQDGCSEAGHQMMECDCTWLCTGKLKEPVPDPPKEEEAKEGDEKPAKDGKDQGKKRGNLDGSDAATEKKKKGDD
jgi:hypothetical protein